MSIIGRFIKAVYSSFINSNVKQIIMLAYLGIAMSTMEKMIYRVDQALAKVAPFVASAFTETMFTL